ncbi:MAG: proline dehydrogenase family protein [Flavobacteriaceae bacterium]|nr:proline dehydrogenase family protein [Flavobacteriaceae bacterium]
MSVFNDSKIAFADKSDAQLKKALRMFKMIESPTLTKIGISILNFTVRNRCPFAARIVKNTLFEQFVGGETREESMKVVNQLFKRGVGSIFDYAIEGKEDEKMFDQTCDEIKKNIEFAEGNPAIPFVVFKPTGFGRLNLYADVQAKKELSPNEKTEWENVVKRYEEVCRLAYEKNVVLMIDAEETWMQNPVDELVNGMMEKYNKEKAVIWNTVQMYRTERMEYLEEDLKRAKEKNYFLGYKFVRGAYMEKERERAEKMNYPDPIQPNKQATDDNFNHAIEFVLNNIDRISSFFGTHNEESVEFAIEKMKSLNLENRHPHVYFGQLFGMSDNITFYLAEKNYNVTKYLPYGPVKDVVPYLTRRAEENTSVSGQTGRELSMIRKELKRRKTGN